MYPQFYTKSFFFTEGAELKSKKKKKRSSATTEGKGGGGVRVLS